ncbi:LLM class flavin-dependent oxidoreductase [Micromonospora sp. NBC_00898]|uniref:LLM class flavin-dependent oxidoreductase n=1 Tax=Micromonospora sp. NBC_00898 TaxID=2975981 RepID=UPI00386F8EAC|nr:LLM class flavin-dependent oxidoreductase [Micromonospora sp. NBC_00898]
MTASLLVELGELAERAGWDGVFFEDYLIYYDGTDPPTYDPWLLLAAIAGRTGHVRLGTTVTSLPRRRPARSWPGRRSPWTTSPPAGPPSRSAWGTRRIAASRRSGSRPT